MVTQSTTFIKLPFGVPGAPEEPKVNEIGTNFVTLSWNKPHSDGPITGYWVEKKEKGSDRWIKCNMKPIQATIYIVPSLIENQEYEFRVFAENEAGLSEPSAASKQVHVNTAFYILTLFALRIFLYFFINYFRLKIQTQPLCQSLQLL